MTTDTTVTTCNTLQQRKKPASSLKTSPLSVEQTPGKQALTSSVHIKQQEKLDLILEWLDAISRSIEEGFAGIGEKDSDWQEDASQESESDGESL